MSSSKLDRSGVFAPLSLAAPQTQLSLPPNAVRVRKNGIEFRTTKAIPVWKEMTVELQSPGETKRVNFSGVVVACEGNRHSGYLVSMVFTSVSRHAQERLNLLGGSLRA
jgi:hypothetical protein